MATLCGKPIANVAIFFQHHVILAVDQVLTDGGDLDMNLCFVPSCSTT
ncbi:MAG: hypothetical protein ACLTXH_12780 [Enterobacter hormaechei]